METDWEHNAKDREVTSEFSKENEKFSREEESSRKLGNALLYLWNTAAISV